MNNPEEESLQNLWNGEAAKHLFSLTGYQLRWTGGVFVGRSLLEYACVRKTLCEPGFGNFIFF